MAGVLAHILLFSLALFGTTSAACPNFPGWMPMQGSCYLISPTALTWFQSEHFCRTKGGYLAEITSAEESELVTSVLQQEGARYWIGLNDLAKRDHWMWQHSLTPMNWSNWASGEPDHKEAPETCVLMSYITSNVHNGWKWYDWGCDWTGDWSGPFALCEA